MCVCLCVCVLCVQLCKGLSRTRSRIAGSLEACRTSPLGNYRTCPEVTVSRMVDLCCGITGALADGATGRAYVGAAVGLNVPTPSAAASAPVPAAQGCVPVPIAADVPSRAPRRRLPPDLGYHDRAWMRK